MDAASRLRPTVCSTCMQLNCMTSATWFFFLNREVPRRARLTLDKLQSTLYIRTERKSKITTKSQTFAWRTPNRKIKTQSGPWQPSLRLNLAVAGDEPLGATRSPWVQHVHPRASERKLELPPIRHASQEERGWPPFDQKKQRVDEDRQPTAGAVAPP